MAELMVGGAFLSAVLKVLFDELASEKIFKLFRGKQAVIDVLGDLRNVVRSVTKLVDHAEEKLITDENVREWSDELKAMVFRADDLVATITSKTQRLELKPHQPSSSRIRTYLFGTSGFDDMVKKEATEICYSIKNLLGQKDNLGLTEGFGISQPPYLWRTTPLVEESGVYGRKGDKEVIVDFEESGVYGRKGDKEVIVDLLLSMDGSEEKLSVISIVGMGGIGKTTLAQLVFNDARVEDHFDLRAWVAVSDDFDIYKINKQILEMVTSQECHIQELFEIQHKLKDSLRGKKFLLVLDDVWNENYELWDSLMSAFPYGEEVSKIIVTTRSRVVASATTCGKTSTYQLGYLSPEDCWLLFSRHAFRDNEDAHAHQDLQAIGREIVKKCKGLPLPVKSLGCVLRFERNPTKWESILKSDVLNELYSKEKNILPALWLIYRRMPAHLKRCFSYCSIFPKDYEFERERIILLWMAEGFLQNDKKSMTMEEVGEDYFEDLVSGLFFQKSSSLDDSIFLMHDLVHDLAIFVSRGFCFKVDEPQDLHSLPRHTRHLSYSKGLQDFGGRICDAKSLRTIMRFGSKEVVQRPYSLPRFLWTSLKYLKVLGLHGSEIKSISASIEKLIQLKYLDLSETAISKLPASICSLYNLQTLLLSKCGNLTALPKHMEKLINLRHLDIEGAPIKEMNFRIENMKSLQTLSKRVVGHLNTSQLSSRSDVSSRFTDDYED